MSNRHLRLRAAITIAVAAAVLAAPGAALAVVQIADTTTTLGDLDARTGSIAPTPAQLDAVQTAGAHVTWNRFGTPESLIKYGGFLATGLGSDPVAAARQYISDNKTLFRLS